MACVLAISYTPAQGLNYANILHPQALESRSDTCSYKYLEPCLFVEALGGAKVNFTWHNKVKTGTGARTWQATKESLFLLINMFSLAKGGEREPSYLWGVCLKRHSQSHRLVLLGKEQEATISCFKGNVWSRFQSLPCSNTTSVSQMHPGHSGGKAEVRTGKIKIYILTETAP